MKAKHVKYGKKLESKCCVCGKSFYELMNMKFFVPMKAFAHPYCLYKREANYIEGEEVK
jgi:hypothetical protein